MSTEHSAHDMPTGPPHVLAERAVPGEGWVRGLSKSAAEDLLDALEARGLTNYTVLPEPGGASFAVRLAPPVPATGGHSPRP